MTDSSVTVDPAHDAAPRRRPAEDRRAQIVAAAFAEFGEKGFDAARLDDVARRAGIAKGTIYLHFADKEALFREMLERLIEDRIALLDTAPAGADPHEAFLVTVRTIWGLLMRDDFPAVHRLITAVLPRFPELSAQFYAHGSGRLRRIVATRIAAVIATGRWRDCDPLDAATMLHMLMLQLASTREIPGSWSQLHHAGADPLAHVLDFFEAAMRPGIAPASTPVTAPTPASHA